MDRAVRATATWLVPVPRPAPRSRPRPTPPGPRPAPGGCGPRPARPGPGPTTTSRGDQGEQGVGGSHSARMPRSPTRNWPKTFNPTIWGRAQSWRTVWWGRVSRVCDTTAYCSASPAQKAPQTVQVGRRRRTRA